MDEERRRFGPDRIALLPVMVFFLGSLPIAGSDGWLNWVVLLPIACGVWVVRARVVTIGVGVEVCNGLRAHRVAWSDVEGFDVPRRGPVRLLREGLRPLPMTALSRRDLPDLLRRASSAKPQP
ncbi:MAG: cfp6 [Frankiales bacterium]|nr:cfp6 [Frankiales bacterium]